jgi:hypothetical protein
MLLRKTSTLASGFLLQNGSREWRWTATQVCLRIVSRRRIDCVDIVVQFPSILGSSLIPAKSYGTKASLSGLALGTDDGG